MGRFDQDIKLILGLLAHGADPDSALSMYQQAVSDQRYRADQRKENRRSLIQSGISEVQQGMPQQAVESSLEALAKTYGVGDKGLAKATDTISGFYEGGASPYQSVWDDTDEEDVQLQVEDAKALGLSRSDVRLGLTQEAKRKALEMGFDYDLIRMQLNDAIDRYYGYPEGYAAKDWRESMGVVSPQPPAAPSPAAPSTPSSGGYLPRTAAYSSLDDLIKRY